MKLSKITIGGIIGIVILAFWIFMAIFGSMLTPYTHVEMDLVQKMAAPSASHILGTDQLGRDIFSRIIIGSRSVLTVSVTAALFSTFLGILVGFSAGYFGGKTDEIIMRFMDILLSMPALVLAMVVVGIMEGTSILTLTLVISIVFTPRTARVARSALLTWKDLEFVDAAKIRGESHLYIMFMEIMPNALGPIIVEATARIAYSVMTVSALGFLGIGLQPPTPDWGMMVSENKSIIISAPWAVLAPTIAIASLVIGVSLLADLIQRRLINE
ncbi:MAG: ABC transporter permease [Clostridia bacterium]